MIVRASRSQTVTRPIPTRQTHGRLERRSSPRRMETRLGTMRPRNGSDPTTTVTVPVARAIRPVPTRTVRR